MPLSPAIRALQSRMSLAYGTDIKLLPHDNPVNPSRMRDIFTILNKQMNEVTRSHFNTFVSNMNKAFSVKLLVNNDVITLNFIYEPETARFVPSG